MKKTDVEQSIYGPISMNRRELLQRSLLLAISATSLPLLNACVGEAGKSSLDGLLLPPDQNGVRLPKGLGLKSRIIARSGHSVAGSSYLWHGAPDGGACFSEEGGGWVYVSNSELDDEKGGVGAIKFDAQGEPVDAYSILVNTNRNCAGGAMPWGTWMSCEESGDHGRVFECDPFGKNPAREIPALGRFNHEAVAYDPEKHHIYLTEDKWNGAFYRFVPEKLNDKGFADLSEGQLQVAEVIEKEGVNSVVWHTLNDPLAEKEVTRSQVKQATSFKGGEGVVYHEGIVYFTTKYDNCVWAFDTDSQEILKLYDEDTSANPILTGVDNITVDAIGNLLVAEDGGDMQIVSLNKKGETSPLLQIVGQDDSEICGPAFSPDGNRLYFSSQRGKSGKSSDGLIYEISGFRQA